MELVDHLFRTESGRMVSVLSRVFGVQNLALAEDVVQDAFCRALSVWSFRGVPENPSAWLMATAKNRALDMLRRQRTAVTHEPELTRLLESEWTRVPVVDQLFGENEIQDDTLRMMFSCCQPRLPEEAQVALVLNILCGFSVDEVAGAFVSSHAAMEKRIQRAKKTLADSKRLFDLADPTEFTARLPAVQRSLYLLFNEGYQGASPEFAIRTDLCREAMRLSALLLRHPLGAVPSTYSLSALMCFNAARLPARSDAAGNLMSLFDQDRALWDQSLVAEGFLLLDVSASGTEVSHYHLEAAIASAHAAAKTTADTDWQQIVSLYDSLRSMRPSPIVALNRAIAVAQLEGPERGLAEIRAIEDIDRLYKYPFYPAARGELELQLGNRIAAKKEFQSAVALARNPAERRFFELRREACKESTGDKD
jgi:RNA polymerase sigma-70 factor (ECF subfamily)